MGFRCKLRHAELRYTVTSTKICGWVIRFALHTNYCDRPRFELTTVVIVVNPRNVRLTMQLHYSGVLERISEGSAKESGDVPMALF